jgi:hypothetical protein
VTAAVEEQDLWVSIVDRGAGFDPADHPIGEPGARGGLRIVENLASQWGVHHLGDGTEVWFRLQLPTSPLTDGLGVQQARRRMRRIEV